MIQIYPLIRPLLYLTRFFVVLIDVLLLLPLVFLQLFLFFLFFCVGLFLLVLV